MGRVHVAGLVAYIDDQVVNLPTTIIHQLADHDHHVLQGITHPYCPDCTTTKE